MRTPVPPGPKKTGEQALGRSKGGFTSKLHLSIDALGLGVRFRLTAGQASDIAQGPTLIKDFSCDFVSPDKGYDSDAFIAQIQAQGATAVIPPRSNRKEQWDYDKHWYRERQLVEGFINKLKHFRRVFSRFEKLAKNYLIFVYFASAPIWLR